MSKFTDVRDAQLRNQTFKHYKVDAVMEPHLFLEVLLHGHHKQKADIAADRKLTAEGKEAAAAALGATAQAAINAWHEQRLKGLDADLLEQRAALRGQVDMPDPKRVDLMASHLLKHSHDDLATFYNSATESERREMEAASAAVGRVPVKGRNGLEWRTLLDPAMVEEAILSRAEQTNPTVAEKVRELVEIRAMQVTLTGVALSEV